MTPDVLYVKQRLQNYLSRIVELSKADAPPGKNAASGHFREHVISDPAIARCGMEPTMTLPEETQPLYNAFTFFYSMVQRAFRDNPNYYAHWSTHSSVLLPNLLAIGTEIVTLAIDIIQLLSAGNDDDKGKARESVARSIEATVHKIEASGSVWEGHHASGWISVGVRDAANATIRDYLDPGFAAGRASDAATIANIFRRMCTDLANLPTKGHEPWLRAEWQVKFQAILQGTIAALDSYK